jgi:tetratricopeptide (TPR) repeat protein
MVGPRWIALLAGAVLAATAGCGPEGTLQLHYDRPAEIAIAPEMRTLGIAQFEGRTPNDRRWGDIASDRLAGRLDEYNQKFHRYQLVDRKRLKAVLDQQDLNAAFSDSSKAVAAGKIAHVDAMIYGSVSVSVRDEHGMKPTIGLHGVEEKPYTRRFIRADVNFTIDGVQTGKTLATLAAKEEYDSDKDKSGGSAAVLSAVGLGSGPSPADKVVSDLIDKCVAQFVARISPHEVTVSEPLLAGKDKAVKTGNTLAMSKDYAEALEAYEAAIRANPNDDEAVFSAGLMYEALGKLDKAAEYYGRAFKIKPEPRYVQARKRVRTETGGEPSAGHQDKP